MDGHAALLFADLAGYTALTEAHGDADAAELAGLFYDASTQALHASARIVKTIGDAVMIVAHDDRAILLTAHRLVERAEALVHFPLLRIGMHCGPVVERAGDYFGATVNLAARIAAHAQGGQLLCTGELARVAHELGLWHVRKLPAVYLKNICAPVTLHELVPPFEAASLIDPVCRMRVSRQTGLVIEDGAMVHVFCSEGCKRAFEERLSHRARIEPPWVENQAAQGNTSSPFAAGYVSTIK
jgi:adenylate cyclase